MKTNISNRFKIACGTIILIILVLSISVFLGFKYRYEYFHLYVHKGLHIFLDSEFRGLLSAYGTNDNISSFEQLKDRFGITVVYPYENERYSIRLRLTKIDQYDNFQFTAEIASPSKNARTGNPNIYMIIPMEHFNEVIEEGLTEKQIDSLVDAANKAGWERIKFDEEFTMKPDVILSFDE